MWRATLSSSKRCVFSELFSSNFSTEIFVSRLSHYTTEDELKNMFLQFGKIEEVRLVRDNKTQRPKGFAFIRFESDTAAENAVKAMDKRIVKSRLLFVEMAKSRPELVANKYLASAKIDEERKRFLSLIKKGGNAADWFIRSDADRWRGGIDIRSIILV